MVQVGERVGRSGSSATTLTLTAVLVFFRADSELVDVNDVVCNYDAYSGLILNPEPVSANDLATLFDPDLYYAQTGDAVKLSKESLNTTRVLVKDLCCAVPVSKKRRVDPFQYLAWEVEDAHWKSEIARRELAKRDEKIVLSFNVRMLSNDSGKMARLQTKVTAKDRELAAVRWGASQSNKALEWMFRAHASLRSELDALHATAKRREAV